MAHKRSNFRERIGAVPFGVAPRRIRALVMVLGCLAATLLITAQSSATPAAQRAADTVKTRTGGVLTGQLLSLDELLIRTSTGTLNRADVDWIAIGAAMPPRPFPEMSAVDLALLASGELISGWIASFDGYILVFEESGIRRTLPIDQVSMLLFCDAPCSVGSASRPTPSPQAALAGLSPTPVGGSGGFPMATSSGLGPSSGTSVPAGTPDTCHGDEQISFSPAEARVGDEVLIAVTSARPYAYPRLTGTELPAVLRNRTGQLGFVYEWTVRPTWPGLHQYVFYVDSTIRCADQHVEVRRALTTPTPRPYSSSNDNNDSDDDDDNDNAAPTATPTLFPTVTPAGPSGSAPGAMCTTFASQAQAQASLRANPTDPLMLDGNRNGIACESADGAGFVGPPFDSTPVPRL